MASPQPRKSGETDASTALGEALADIVRKANFYLRTDLDQISRDTIAEDIDYLESIDEYLSKVKKGLPLGIRIAFTMGFKRIAGLASQIIAHLYRARGYATKGVPRNYEYYDHMQKARRIWRDIKNTIESHR
jgi:hypothetical protein